jgi:hypothetical protein
VSTPLWAVDKAVQLLPPTVKTIEISEKPRPRARLDKLKVPKSGL